MGKMLEYLCAVARGEGAGVGTDPERITLASSVLEAFGNATTGRNDNSSRFGRFTRLYFDNKNIRVKGCGTEAYLLERSRIPGKTANERNYHVFMQLVRSSDASKYKLDGNCKSYEYTKLGADVKQPGIYVDEGGDKGDYDDLVKRLGQAGFSDEEKGFIFKTVAAVIHLGNTKI